MDAERLDRLEAILLSAVDAIIIIDEEGRIEVANPATTHMFGYELFELLGRNVSLLIAPPHQEAHDSYLGRYRSTGKKRIIGSGREVLGLKKDGSLFPVHIAVSEFRSGERRFFTGIVRDVSDLKAVQKDLERLNADLERRVLEKTKELREAQEELIQKERLVALGQVSGGLAHEIRNPLNVVKTSVYFLLHGRDPSEEKVREHLERIDRQVNLIDQIVAALTDATPMLAPCFEWLDIRQQVDEALEQVDLSERFQVVNQLPEIERIQLRADRNQLAIVFRNLLRNAKDAMPNGGQITIGGHQQPRQVILFVQDDGDGIAAEHIRRIAEPFFSTKPRGMGLGLAVSKTIIEKNGGSLEVESKPGEGSRFSLVFPVTEPDASA